MASIVNQNNNGSTPKPVVKASSTASGQRKIQRIEASGNPKKEGRSYMAKVESNGKTYTLTPDEYNGVKDLYKQAWQGQYGQDDEDQLNLRNGVMPRSFANSYKKGDKSLYDLGLPNSKYFEKYLEAYRTAREEQKKIETDYRNKNERLSQFYSAVSKKWFDDEYKNGTYDANAMIEGDTNTWDQRRQQQFFDMLDLPEWSDVKNMYDLSRRKSKVKEPSDYKSVQEYYEAKFDADAKQRAAYAKVDSADAKALATGKKSTEKQLAEIVGEDIVDSERASVYSVGFTFDDFSKMYGDQIYRRMLAQNLVDTATGEVVKDRTAGDVIADIDRAKALKKAIDTPERYVQEYTDSDYVAMMQDLVEAGLPPKTLKAIREEAISRIDGNPSLTDEQKKEQKKGVKEVESAPRKEITSKVASWVGKNMLLPAAISPINFLDVKGVKKLEEIIAERAPAVETAKKFLGEYKINSPADYVKALEDMKATKHSDAEIREAYKIALRNTTSRDREEIAIAYNNIATSAYDIAQKIRSNYYKEITKNTFGPTDDTNEVGRGDGSSMSVDEATSYLNRALSARTRATEEGIDTDFRQMMDILHRQGVTAPVMREAANRILSSWSRTGQIPPDDIENVIASIRDITDENETKEHKEIFDVARDELEARNFSPLEIHQAFSRMGWQDALNEEDWARAYYTEYQIPQEMLNSEDAEEWRAMSEDERVARASEVWNNLNDEERANLTKEFIDGIEYNPIINKDYGRQITEQWFGAWAKTAVGLVTGGFNIAQLITTAFGNDPTKLAAAIATGQELKGWDAFNANVSALNDVQRKLSMYGKAVDQNFLSDVISTGADVFAEILRMQTMNFIGQGFANPILKGAGVEFVESATGAQVPVITAKVRGLNRLAQMAASMPFISDATANYWAEAIQQEGATVGDAVSYALICGFFEGAVEKLNADHIFKRMLGGDAVADGLIKSARNLLKGGDVMRTAKVISLVGSALGEGSEEGLSYIISLIMGNLTFNKGKRTAAGIFTGFNLEELKKESGMGALVGLFANTATLSTYTAEDYITDYLLTHKVSHNTMDLLYASAVVENMSDDELNAMELSGSDILTLSEFKSKIADLLQVEANLKTHRNEVEKRISDASANLQSLIDKVSTLEQQMQGKTSSKKKKEISAQLWGEDGNGGLYSKVKEARKVLNDAKTKQVQELINNVKTMSEASSKQAELIKRHYVALYYLMKDQITAMSDVGKAEGELEENAAKLAEAEKAISLEMKKKKIDLAEMDRRIREVGVSSDAITDANTVLALSEPVLAKLDAKMNSAKDGSVKENDKTSKGKKRKTSAKELKDGRKAKTSEAVSNAKQAKQTAEQSATPVQEEKPKSKRKTKKNQTSESAPQTSQEQQAEESPVAEAPVEAPTEVTAESSEQSQLVEETVSEPTPEDVERAQEDSERADIERRLKNAVDRGDKETARALQWQLDRMKYDISDPEFGQLYDVMVGLDMPNSSLNNLQENIKAGKEKLSEETMDKIRKIMSKFGRHVIFTDLETNKGGGWDGDFIYINRYQDPVDKDLPPEHAVIRTLLHEFTHSLKTTKHGTAEYIRLSKLATKWTLDLINEQLESKGKQPWTMKQLIAAKQKQYFVGTGGEYGPNNQAILDRAYYEKRGPNENGYVYPTILDDETAVDELTARRLQEELLFDQKFINMLVREESGLAGRVLNFVQYCISKIGSQDSVSQLLSESQRMFAKAFVQSNKSPSFGYRNFKMYSMNYSQFKDSSEASDLATRYSDAVRNRDVQKAQEIVSQWANLAFKDSAAPRDENGMLLPLYHGTMDSGVTSFYPDKAVFTALDKRVALTYASYSSKNALDAGRKGKPGIYTFYADVRKPFVLDCNKTDWMNIVPSDAETLPDDFPVYGTTDMVVDWARRQIDANGKPLYDSVLFKNINDSGDGTERIGTNLVVFDPRNLKSADPFTFAGPEQAIPIDERFNTSVNNVLYDISGDDTLLGDLDANEADMLDQLRQIDEQIADTQDESLIVQRNQLQNRLDILRRMRDTDWSADIRSRFDTPNNSPRHSLAIPGLESLIGKKGSLTANELDRVYRKVGKNGRQRIISSIAQNALKGSKARDKSTGKLIVWETGTDGNGWARRYDPQNAGENSHKSFMNLNNPLVVDAKGRNSNSIKTSGNPIHVTIRRTKGGNIVFETTTRSGKKSRAYFDTASKCEKWVRQHYGDDVVYSTIGSFGASEVANTYGDTSIDTTIYSLSSANNEKMYSASAYVNLDFLENYARACGYDGVICNNVADGGDLAYSFDDNKVISADPTTYASDGSEIMPSERFKQEAPYYRDERGHYIVDQDHVDEFLEDHPEYVDWAHYPKNKDGGYTVSENAVDYFLEAHPEYVEGKFKKNENGRYVVDVDDVETFLQEHPEYLYEGENSLSGTPADNGRAWLYDLDGDDLDLDDFGDDEYYGEDDYEYNGEYEDEEGEDSEVASVKNIINVSTLTPEEIDKAYFAAPKGSPVRAEIIRQCAELALANSQFRDKDGKLIDMYRGSGTSAGYTVSDPAYADDFLSIFASADLGAATYVSGKLLPVKMMELVTQGDPGKYLSDDEYEVYEKAADQAELTPVLNFVTRKLAEVYDNNRVEHTVSEVVYDHGVPVTISSAEELYDYAKKEHHIIDRDVANWDVQWFGHTGDKVPTHMVSVFLKDGSREDYFYYDNMLLNGSDAVDFLLDNSDIGEDDADFIEDFRDFGMFDYIHALNDFDDIFNRGNIDFDIRDVESVIGSGLKSTNPEYDEKSDYFSKQGIYHWYLNGKNVLVVDAQGDAWNGIRVDNIPDFVDGPPEGVKTKTAHITYDGVDRKVGKGNWKKSDYRNAVIYETVESGDNLEKKVVFSVKDEIEKAGGDPTKFVSARDFFNLIKDSGVFGTQASTVAEAVSKNEMLYLRKGVDDGNYYVNSYVTGTAVAEENMSVISMLDRDLEQATDTRMLGHYAYDHGYDGYIVTNIEDYGGKESSYAIQDNIDFNQGGRSMIAVVFNPQQTKSADVETYDDNGKVIPPSQRFNLNEEEMRYNIEGTIDDFLGFGDVDMERAQNLSDAIKQANIESDFVNAIQDVQKDWKRYGRKYGTIPEGMDPKARTISVPKKIADDVAVSKSVRTIIESAHITDPDQVRMLQEMVLNQTIGTYTPESTKEVYDRAVKDLSETYGGDLNRALDGLQKQVSRGTISADTIALAEAIMAEAGKVGDNDLFYRTLAEYEIAGRIGGRIVSQASLLKRTSGVGQAYYVQRFVDQLNSVDYKNLIARKRMDPITIDPSLMKQLAMANDPAVREEIIDAICQNIGEQIPPTFFDALRAWRYLSMLGNPTTHVRNFVGNVMMRGLSVVKDGVASKMEKLFVAEGERTHAVLTAQDRADMDDVAERLFEQYYDDIVADGKYSIRQEIEQNYRNFFAVRRNGKYQASILDKISKINTSGIEGSKIILGLEGADRVFLRAGFKDAFMQYVKANGLDVNNLTEQQQREAVRNAIEQAKVNTFRNANQFATYLQKISQMNKVANVIVEGLVPFKKTPMNVLARGIDYSPLGLAVGLYDLLDNAVGNKMGETELRHKASEVVDKFASGFTGSALFVLGALLSKIGLLRGSGEDDDDYEKLLKEDGEQPYSLNIGNLSISLANIAPATIPLFMGVAMNEAAEKTGSDNALMDMVSTLSSIANPMMEMSMLSSINEALQTYGTSGIAGNLGNVAWASAKSYAGQYLPTFPSKVFDAIDPVQRTTKSNAAAKSADLDYFARSLVKKTPLESTLQPMVDLHGREVNHGIQDKFDLWLTDALSGFISPGTIKIKNYDAADREIVRLVRSTGETDFVPASPQKYLMVNGEKINLTAKQYTQFSKEYGQAIYSAINNLIYTDKYINAPDPERSVMLSDAVSGAKRTIRDIWKDRVQFNTDSTFDTKKAEVPADVEYEPYEYWYE